MSTSNFTILRQCEHCSIMFQSQKRTTRFCSQACTSKNYKLRKRLELKNEVEAQVMQKAKPKVDALNIEIIRQKDFLKVNEVAALIGCSKQTIYRMIEAKDIKAVNLRHKTTRIRRKDLEQLFEKPTVSKPESVKIEDCYLMPEILEKYKVSPNTIYNLSNKHKVNRIKKNGITYYSKFDIDQLFNI